MTSGTQHELIVAVTDADGVDIVMDAARAAGARGGTVARAREVCSETAQKLFGLPIQPEKELVLILVAGRHSPDGDAGHLRPLWPSNTAPARFHLFAACQRGAGPALIAPVSVWGFLQSCAYLKYVFA